MKELSPCVATADEPIPELVPDRWSGPDMKTVMPIEMMLGLLHHAPDARAYVAIWLMLIKSFGAWPSLTISREGEEELRIGVPCDEQLRHRYRWQHFLTEDLNSDPERRELLVITLITKGRYADNRPAEPRSTTRAIRDFVRTGGRILIEPDGTLSEGGGLPRSFTHGTDEEAAECVRASRAYFAVRRRWRSDRHIKRAVAMLGERTNNGWMVLEARS
jgi:hypothetical protein